MVLVFFLYFVKSFLEKLWIVVEEDTFPLCMYFGSFKMRRTAHMLLKFRPFSLRIFAFTITLLLMIIITWTFFVPDVRNAKQCFRPKLPSNLGSIKYFEDVMDSNKMPSPGKSIFFHETSCSKSGIVQLNAR